MKASFYFVLWQLAWLLVGLLNIPFLNEYGFFFACIIVFFADRIINRFLKNQIEYQQICAVISIMEMAYNNDYKKFKRQALLQMVVYTALFIYMLSYFVALFTSFSNVPLIDYILWGTFTILAGISSLQYIRLYLQARKTGYVMLDKELQEIYQSYKNERDSHTYEEMLLPRPKHYKATNTANTLFAILSIVTGLLAIAILYAYRGESNFDTELVEFSMIIYGALASYWGIKDLLSTSNSQKYLLLLLSCAIAVLSYKPITHYMNKKFLAAYIADVPNLIYNTKDNLIQETITLDELDGFETTYVKQRSMLFLSFNDKKELLKKIIRTDAEYQFVFRDKSSNKQIIIISPSELKEIYHQTKSNLNILLEVLKLDFEGAKVYDDGEYIVVEIWRNENVPYSMQSEHTKVSEFLANVTKESAQNYGVADFDRGLKIRCIFNDGRFIEHTLSLEELKKEEEQTDVEESEKDSTSLFNIFSNSSNNDE